MLGEAVIRLLDPPQVRRPTPQNDAHEPPNFRARDLDWWSRSVARGGKAFGGVVRTAQNVT
jgi:hypothetical protein